jgi:hypothetical protein
MTCWLTAFVLLLFALSARLAAGAGEKLGSLCYQVMNALRRGKQPLTSLPR